jgi:hypothetical protein
MELEATMKVSATTVASLGLSNKHDAASSTKLIEDLPQETSTLLSENWLSSRTLFPEVEKLYGLPYEVHTIAIHPSGSFVIASCNAIQAEAAQLKCWRTLDWYLLS